ncbi:MAG: PPC domain-containing protein [Caldilinea sp.]
MRAPARAQGEATPILLGEFVRASLEERDEVVFALTVPIDGVYTVVYTGEGSPSDFLMAVVDVDGAALYDDVMQNETSIELVAGSYALLFTAQAEAELQFATGIEAGSMTDDYDAPGELFNGATFITENVTGPLYAKLVVESSPYPQQMAVLVQGAASDVYEAELTSTASFDYTNITTDESEFLRVVTTGGVYDLTIAPTEGGAALQVSIFLSGPAPALEVGVETNGELDSADDTDTYQFTISEAGTVVSVTASSVEALDLSAGFLPGEGTWTTNSYGDEPASLTFIAPEAGTYYVELTTDAEAGVAYTVLVEEGDQAAVLLLNEPTKGEAPAGASIGYLVKIDEPEQFLIAMLVGPADDDLDLVVRRYEDGRETAYGSSSTTGSREIVALYSEEPGTYIVLVDGSWSNADADFVILASTGAVADLIDLLDEAEIEDEADATPTAEPTPAVDADDSIAQWVTDAEASSQYSDDAWSARQVIGAPDTPEPGDEITAWAALSSDLQLETLILSYAQAVIPTGIEIYETYNPGAVTVIAVIDPNTDEWVVVWEGVADTIGEEIAIFSPTLTPVAFATTQVRLTIDEPSVPGWNEIDAVKLIGIPE